MYDYKLFLFVNDDISGAKEQLFYFILSERWCSAFLTVIFVIALPDDLPVPVVTVPDLYTRYKEVV